MPSTDEELYIKIRKLITSGRQDEFLDMLAQKITERRTVLRQKAGRENLSKLEVGMEVRIRDAVRPQYLGGQLAEVEEITNRMQRGQIMVLVKLYCGPIGKFRNGRVLMAASSFDIMGVPSGPR